jgi:hypothetical protein
MPKDWVISENQAPNFSKNGKQFISELRQNPLPKTLLLLQTITQF